jgi:hypothetical protein
MADQLTLKEKFHCWRFPRKVEFKKKLGHAKRRQRKWAKSPNNVQEKIGHLIIKEEDQIRSDYARNLAAVVEKKRKEMQESQQVANSTSKIPSASVKRPHFPSTKKLIPTIKKPEKNPKQIITNVVRYDGPKDLVSSILQRSACTQKIFATDPNFTVSRY